MNQEQKKLGVFWKIRCINKADRAFFDRHLILDSTDMTPEDLVELEAALAARKSEIRVLEFRQHFKEYDPQRINELAGDCTSVRMLGSTLGGIEYFEDEDGNPLDEVGLAEIVTGHKDPILRGNVKSVLRLGPTGVRNKSDWTEETADNIAHFIELVRAISRSNWLQEPLSFTSQGEECAVVHADSESTQSVLLFVRQLLLKQDDVLNEACKGYLNHADHDGKRAWIAAEQDSFNSARTGSSFPNFLPDHTTEEIIDMVTYGAGAAHRKSRGKWEEKLPSILAKYGREKLALPFLSSARREKGFAGSG